MHKSVGALTSELRALGQKLQDKSEGVLGMRGFAGESSKLHQALQHVHTHLATRRACPSLWGR